MPIPNRAPGQCWSFRKDFDGYVRTEENDTVVIVPPRKDSYVNPGERAIRMSRKDARLLAKRINECLDATRKG